MSNKKNTGSKLQGVSRLVTDATIGVTDLVESMHHRIVHPPLLPSTPIQHLITSIAGIVYKNVRWSAKLIGSGADNALGLFSSLSGKIKTTDESEALSAVLNGVIGDYLEKTENPLEINMQFRYRSQAIVLDKEHLEKTYSKINGKILLMLHGSCMNDIQWTRKEHNHGTTLAKDFHKTPIFLHYNSGRHISTNGQDLNNLLEELVLHWPVPIEEINIVAHSMGGLVTRSAIHYSKQQNSWTKYLKKIIFLGTPHHGAPLEQAGNYLDVVLEAVPYVKPFARLGKIRSAGVTDLRYGNLLDEDWKNFDRFEIHCDQRQHVSLPKKVECYSIAGVVGATIETNTAQFLGDNMVGVKSALGKHKNPAKDLNFKKENTWIAYESNHLDLLSNPKVYAKIKTWMV